MEFKKARKVYPLDGMVIGVLFEGGEFKKYDLEPLTRKWPVFNALRYRNLFESARVEAGGHGIVWNEDIDLAAEEVYLMVFRGRMPRGRMKKLWNWLLVLWNCVKRQK